MINHILSELWCHFHAFYWQNSCLDISFVLQKYNCSIKWKIWKLHVFWKIWWCSHLITVAVNSKKIMINIMWSWSVCNVLKAITSQLSTTIMVNSRVIVNHKGRGQPYGGVSLQNRTSLNASYRGNLMLKSPINAIKIIEKICSKPYNNSRDKRIMKRNVNEVENDESQTELGK